MCVLAVCLASLWLVASCDTLNYHEGYFYRLNGGVWEVSLRADVWEPAGYDRLPPGLRIKSKAIVAAGNGNSLVKLNGNGNSLVKLNGNSNGQGNGRK